MIETPYIRLGKAAELLGAETETLLIAAGSGDVQLCVNIYGRATGMAMEKLAEIGDLERPTPMPDGVFVLYEDTARFLEQYPEEGYDITVAVTINERGSWIAEFDPPVTIRTSDLVMLREELSRLQSIQSKPVHIEPNGSHVSDNLVLLNRAARCLWGNADRGDPSTHPTNAHVAAWLMDKGLSQTLAKRGASLIRPEWAHKGRKPEG